MEFYTLRIGKTRYKNISMIGAAAVIARRGREIKENYSVDPVTIHIDMVNHRDAVRMAWYDDNGKIFLSINRKGA
ncbi:MAG: hypothetical protein IKW20_05850 [Bacteroidales bacterium]|nr:hypothetical protein [Bacteroidales bacterium]